MNDISKYLADTTLKIVLPPPSPQIPFQPIFSFLSFLNESCLKRKGQVIDLFLI